MVCNQPCWRFSARSWSASSLAPQILPIDSDPPGCLDPEADPHHFLLCDDLPDGELEQGLTLLQPGTRLWKGSPALTPQKNGYPLPLSLRMPTSLL